MYSVTIREHIMITHSLESEIFGKAQQSHGATLIVDTTFFAEELDGNNLVVDINAATALVQQVLNRYNYQNLDDMEEFSTEITTIEFLAKYLFEQIRLLLSDPAFDREDQFSNIQEICIQIKESHLAWASFRESIER